MKSQMRVLVLVQLLVLVPQTKSPLLQMELVQLLVLVPVLVPHRNLVQA